MVSKSNQNTRNFPQLQFASFEEGCLCRRRRLGGLTHGFTILETIVATGVMVAGLVSIASLFTTSINTNLTNRQRTAATLLLVDKLEQFRVTPLGDSTWAPGGALTTDSPVPGYFDTTVAADGQAYVRVWQITGTSTRIVTVIVCADHTGLTGKRTQLVRATTMLGPAF